MRFGNTEKQLDKLKNSNRTMYNFTIRLNTQLHIAYARYL